MRREQELKDEREEFIRSLSHDIRTPLTSILSYSELLAEKEDLGKEETQNYIALVRSKSEQMKRLISQLSGQSNAVVEKIDDIGLLMRQLTFEWEELLDENFDCHVDLSHCGNFPCAVDTLSLIHIYVISALPASQEPEPFSSAGPGSNGFSITSTTKTSVILTMYTFVF